jgi:hypothetical protein
MSGQVCPMCGYAAAPGELQWVCRECPVAPKCGLACCPRCRYEYPPESRLAAGAVAMWRSIKGAYRHDRAA